MISIIVRITEYVEIIKGTFSSSRIVLAEDRVFQLVHYGKLLDISKPDLIKMAKDKAVFL